MKLLSFRQYAEHRGVSPFAVTKAVKAGRISVVADSTGRRFVDPKKADEEWDANSDASKQIGGYTVNQGGDSSYQSGPVFNGNVPEQKSGPGGGPSYTESRAIREAYQARIAKLTYEEKSGKLVSANEIKVQAFQTARIVREGILNIPDRLASQLAGETDSNAIHSLLTDELTRALKEITGG